MIKIKTINKMLSTLFCCCCSALETWHAFYSSVCLGSDPPCFKRSLATRGQWRPCWAARGERVSKDTVTWSRLRRSFPPCWEKEEARNQRLRRTCPVTAVSGDRRRGGGCAAFVFWWPRGQGRPSIRLARSQVEQRVWLRLRWRRCDAWSPWLQPPFQENNSLIRKVACK